MLDHLIPSHSCWVSPTLFFKTLFYPFYFSLDKPLVCFKCTDNPVKGIFQLQNYLFIYLFLVLVLPFGSLLEFSYLLRFPSCLYILSRSFNILILSSRSFNINHNYFSHCGSSNISVILCLVLLFALSIDNEAFFPFQNVT